MNNKELVYRKLELMHIEIVKYPLAASKGFYIEIENKKYICISDKLTENEAFYVVAHELCHLELNNNYELEKGPFRIAMAERETNDRMLNQLGLVSDVIKLKLAGVTYDEIKKELQIPDDVFELAMQHIYRRVLNLYEK